MSLYAIGDLHLHFQAELKNKAQLTDPLWRDHERRLMENCRRLIRPEDTLVLVGDHSWGRKMAECERDFDYIIIHGSGLIRGKEVSKLLSDRIDKAIEVYRLDPTKPIMIPSGGRGRDEEISEAEAMEGYLLAHGIPQEHIIREDRSGTTRENLIFSRKIIESREGSRYTALVTSNYHVWRALSICRDLDFECTGIGAHVAPYYWPSAVIREFVALISTKKHLLVFAAGWVLCVFPLMSRIMTAVSQ